MLNYIRRRSRLEQLESRRMLAVTVDFEDVGAGLAAESFFNGPDPDGAQQPGPFGDTVVVGEFQSRGARFNNTHSLDFGSWSGWAYSNTTDTTTPGFMNQHSAFAGGGAEGSATYGVAFGGSTIELPNSPEGLQFDSLSITNTTYAALSMRDGDAFAKQFGGPSGDDPDYLLLSIEGLDATGASVGVVDFYLADYRFADNSLDYIVDTWTEVDISSLAAAETLSFTWDSTDVGDFGINTPLYAAVDNIELTDSVAADPLSVDAGGPYSISEGDSLALSGSAAGAGSPTYSWDVNGDGTFGDAAGADPTLTWEQLTALGIDDGDSGGTTFNVTLQVTDGASTATASTTLTLANTAPSVAINGPADAEAGQSLTFQLTATDPSPADTFSYTIDWGDGTSDQVTGNASATTTHAYADANLYTVTVTATDDDGGESAADTHQVSVSSIEVGGDGDITINGSDSAGDRIVIYPLGEMYAVRMNNVTSTIVAAERIVVHGRGGNDFLVVAGRLDIPVLFHGGDGNDYLAGGSSGDSLVGGTGNDILLAGEGDNFADGGDGSDRIEGRSGRDTLLGGAGNDRINGGGGDDLLSGGTGNDLLFGDLGDDLLTGGSGNDSLLGHFGNDLLLGGDHADQLRGGFDHDLLVGGSGADRLRGEAGDDTLAGGSSDWEALLDAALADLQTSGTPLPASIQSVIEGWASGGDPSPLMPFLSDSAVNELLGGSGVNTLIP